LNITVVGTGYVGLTTAVCFASKGHRVRCVDIDEAKVEKINRGVSPIFEEGMDYLLKKVVQSGLLSASTSLEESVSASDLSFICVGTPYGEDGSIDLSQVSRAAVSVGLALKRCAGRRHVVVVKSTVLPGTAEKVVIPGLEMSGAKLSLDFGVCVNPEFLREGQAIMDFLNPKDTGIVIGESDRVSGDVVASLYSGFPGTVMVTGLREAEMIKYARNAYLAKDVSFANEVANICSAFSIDYLGVRRGMELDSRIGVGRFLTAGLGYGGSCFKKDVTALIRRAKSFGVETRLLNATEEVNDEQPSVVYRLVERALGDLRGRRVTVLGLAFKEGTDDVRESRALKIVDLLVKAGCRVTVYDPKAMDNAKSVLSGRVSYAGSVEDSLNECDVCVVATEWPEFRKPDPKMLPSGVKYYGVGYPASSTEVVF